MRHVVSRIIAPFGVPIEERPPVPTAEERIAERERKRAEKDERRRVRKEKRASAASTNGEEGGEKDIA